MARILRVLVTVFAIVGWVAIAGPALSQPKGNKDRKEQKEQKGQKDAKERKDGTEKHAKAHKHHDAKDLVGDKVKKDGRHSFHQNGKNTAYVDVKGGKIAGVTVKHAEKGDVPVKKYKSSKKMAEGPTVGGEPASLVPAQTQSIGTLWIGYAYIDEYDEEIIFWFPYDMILDGDTGAIWYVAMD
jgi:hypothetical protein